MTEEQINKWFWCFRGWCDGVRTSNILHKHILDLIDEAEAEGKAGIAACKERVRELEGLAERVAGRKCCCITPCEPEDVCAPCQARKLMEAQEQSEEE